MLSEGDLKTINHLNKEIKEHREHIERYRSLIDDIRRKYHNIIKDLKFIKIMAIDEAKITILFHEYLDDLTFLHYLKTNDTNITNTIIEKKVISLFVDISGNIVKEYLK